MQTKRATLSFNSVHLNFRAKKFMGTPTVLQLRTGFGLEEDGVKIWDSFEIGLVLSILVVSQMSQAKRGESGMLLIVIYEIK